MIEFLNNNKLFLGAMLILLNIGSKYLVDEFSENPKEYTQNQILRRLAIFAVCFVGTRDVVISLLLTAGFIIIAQGLSYKNRESMANKQEIEKSEKKVDCPASSSDKPMFADTMDPSMPIELIT